MANIKCEDDCKVSFCSGCLSSDRVLSPLNENEDIFQIICGNIVTQIMLCWECTAMLRGVRIFQRQVANAQRTLHFDYKGKENQPETPQSLSNLTFDTKTYCVGESNGTDVNQFIEIKMEIEESKEDVDVKKEIEECKDLDCTEDNSKEDLDEWSSGDCVEDAFDVKDESYDGGLTNTTATAVNQLLPEKSRKLYERAHEDFMKWRLSKNCSSFAENILLLYFEELSGKFKAPTLCSIYSMLKSTLIVNHSVDISNYTKLIEFLKRRSEGYTGKKSKTFSPEEINRFLKEAPNDLYLSTKIALIFGVMGACRRHELYNISVNDVEVYESTILVKINNRKSNTTRTFAITGSHYELCRKYIASRPVPCKNHCFFLNYKSGKCTTQKVGINKFGTLGRTIASYLELPNPEMYTGHCFRRTSATLLVNTDGDIWTLKRHGR